MKIWDYTTKGGNNLIKEYLSKLPIEEASEGYRIRHKIILNGLQTIREFNTRQLKDNFWEIKFSKNRIMYILQDNENVYFLHVCRTLMGKADQFQIETAISRANEQGFII